MYKTCMDRKSLLALLGSRFAHVAPREPSPQPADPRSPHQVYLAAQAIRSRIDAALDASRRG